MKELIKKAFYLGVGAAMVTKDKVEEFVDELIKKGEASQAEKGKLIDEFMEKAKEREKEIADRVKTLVRKNVEELKVPRKKDLDAVNKRIEALEKKIEQLQASQK